MARKSKKKEDQCQHVGGEPREGGGGKCSRCKMPMAPLNSIRFWSPFWSNVSSVRLSKSVTDSCATAIVQAMSGTTPLQQAA